MYVYGVISVSKIFGLFGPQSGAVTCVFLHFQTIYWCAIFVTISFLGHTLFAGTNGAG